MLIRMRLREMLCINSEISREINDKFKELFLGNYVNKKRPSEPKVKAEMKLKLRTHQPFHFTPRRLSYTEKNELRKILERLQKGVIRLSNFEYASPIVLVKKKNSIVSLVPNGSMLPNKDEGIY